MVSTLACFLFPKYITHKKNIGIKKVAKNVLAIIPPIIPVPSEWRLAAPAPEAMANGRAPKINASEVITIGRKRSRAASIEASCKDFPACMSSTANSTIKIAFFADSPMRVTRATWK
ncbi:hypothetical protein D3C72_1824990 [compost metagenome]